MSGDLPVTISMVEPASPVVKALVFLLFGALGWIAADLVGSPYRRKRMRRWFRCRVLRKHDPGPVRDAVGGRRIQRCDWCDKVVREYEVTVNEAKMTSIRRID